MLLLFADREAEVAQLPSEGKVLPVSESHETALLQIELAFAVDELLVSVYADYLGKEHGVGAEEL